VSDEARQALVHGLKRLEIRLSPQTQDTLIAYAWGVMDYNRQTNLTGARDVEAFVSEQVLDSLSVLRVVELSDPVVDIGSGAGLPGIPLAIARPQNCFVLIEPRAKRAHFLEEVTRRLGLHNVAVVKASALGDRAAAWRGKAGTVLIRAVAIPEKAMRLGAPLLRPEGSLAMFVGRVRTPTKEETRIAQRSSLVNLRLRRVPSIGGDRCVWLARKAAA
jgi:16S rRNA (guanine527-N7)-methyltransferase